ncbi:hypothetical protein D3C81_1616680 [compost metagenome]
MELRLEGLLSVCGTMHLTTIWRSLNRLLVLWDVEWLLSIWPDQRTVIRLNSIRRYLIWLKNTAFLSLFMQVKLPGRIVFMELWSSLVPIGSGMEFV